jgi:pimeloyl-ACP methyl ester carboxylesterase
METARRVLVSVLVIAGWLPGCAGSRGEGGGGDDGPGDANPACGASLAAKNGFPGDFPELVDGGGFGQGATIIGFGGDTTTDRSCNRAALRRRPVILLHGNGASALHAQFGMVEVAEKLRAAGYVDAEIWAPSYLGQNVSSAETSTPYRNNIDDVRGFIDAVVEYLGVDQVDIVGHSLGCGMANGYLRGLKKDGTFDPALARLERVGTVVCLGGAIYGTGSGFLYQPEFDLDGAFVTASLTTAGVEDATPYGAASAAEMQGPATGGTLPKNRDFHATSTLDGGGRRIHWVALWAIGDIVDANLKNAGGLGGADLNRGFELSGSAPGVFTPQLAKHINLLHDQGVVDAFLPYLDR